VAQPIPETPNELDLAIDFVNTLDVETDSDALATVGGLTDWFTERELLSPRAARPKEADRRQAVELREALRSLMLANNGGPREERAGETLKELSVRTLRSLRQNVSRLAGGQRQGLCHQRYSIIAARRTSSR